MTSYQLMTDLVDNIVSEAMLLRATIGMPERESLDIPDEASEYYDINPRLLSTNVFLSPLNSFGV